jgi:hypothetical protein
VKDNVSKKSKDLDELKQLISDESAAISIEMLVNVLDGMISRRHMCIQIRGKQVEV